MRSSRSAAPPAKESLRTKSTRCPTSATARSSPIRRGASNPIPASPEWIAPPRTTIRPALLLRSKRSMSKSIAAADCVLFLWATAPMLQEALEVVEAWGFSYKTCAVWSKDRIGTGYWFRNKHEIWLVGTRGHVPAPAMGTRWPSLIRDGPAPMSSTLSRSPPIASSLPICPTASRPPSSPISCRLRPATERMWRSWRAPNGVRRRLAERSCSRMRGSPERCGSRNGPNGFVRRSRRRATGSAGSFGRRSRARLAKTPFCASLTM